MRVAIAANHWRAVYSSSGGLFSSIDTSMLGGGFSSTPSFGKASRATLEWTTGSPNIAQVGDENTCTRLNKVLDNRHTIAHLSGLRQVFRLVLDSGDERNLGESR